MQLEWWEGVDHGGKREDGFAQAHHLHLARKTPSVSLALDPTF